MYVYIYVCCVFFDSECGMRVYSELLKLGYGQEFYLDPCPAQEFYSVCQPVLACVDHSSDASLYDEFGAFHTGRVCDVECATVAVIVASGYFSDGVGLCVEHVGFGEVVIVFAYIFESGWCAVVPIADDAFVFYDERSHLASLAVAVFAPDVCHPEVPAVEFFLFVHSVIMCFEWGDELFLVFRFA